MMSEVPSVTIMLKKDTEILGHHDRRRIVLSPNGEADIEEFTAEPYDEFTESPIVSKCTLSFDFDVILGIIEQFENSGEDSDVRIQTVSEDGTETCFGISCNSDDFDRLCEIIGRDLFEFECGTAQRIRMNSYTKEQIDRLLSDGMISEETYESSLSEIARIYKRSDDVSVLIRSGMYPFTAQPSVIISDHDEGLITDEQYNMFVWYIVTSRRFGSADRSSEFISMKIKFSVWGQRLLGRYDTFEFVLDREDCELIDRRYSVHGTLFEGCGNYKAPDAAEHTAFTKERTHEVFRYLGLLNDIGILGKDHSENRFDCAFFDLYTRMEDGTSLHTKGTSDYPIFVKFLMLALGQDIRYIC